MFFFGGGGGGLVLSLKEEYVSPSETVPNEKVFGGIGSMKFHVVSLF